MALEPEGTDYREQEDQDPQEAYGAPAYQAMILFREFPRLDIARLREAINALEPAEEACEVSEFSIGTLEPSSKAAEFLPREYIGRHIGTGVVSWSDLRLAIVLHEWRAPEESLQFAAGAGRSLPAVSEALDGHQAYALVNCLDVRGEFHPMERMILLIKCAIAMADQGALAYVNEHNATFFPTELLTQLGEVARSSVAPADEDFGADELEAEPDGLATKDEEDEEGERLSLWDSLRKDGLPPELLVSLIPVEDEYGQLWFVPRGHAQCELPELAFKADSLARYEEIDGHFKNIFSYMVQNGPVLQPGHTLGYDEHALMRFSEIPADREFLGSPYGTLLVTLEPSA
mgnify:CR=1 FL=1